MAKSLSLTSYLEIISNWQKSGKNRNDTRNTRAATFYHSHCLPCHLHILSTHVYVHIHVYIDTHEFLSHLKVNFRSFNFYRALWLISYLYSNLVSKSKAFRAVFPFLYRIQSRIRHRIYWENPHLAIVMLKIGTGRNREPIQEGISTSHRMYVKMSPRRWFSSYKRRNDVNCASWLGGQN